MKNLDGLTSDLETLYKDVHAHPELSMQEERTADLAAQRLRAAGHGVTTGIGGGMVRDVLANEIPAVLRSDLYALAALACAAIVAAGHVLGLHPVGPAIVGMLVCFALRFMAIQYGWHLPAERLVHGNKRKGGEHHK